MFVNVAIVVFGALRFIRHHDMVKPMLLNVTFFHAFLRGGGYRFP